MVPAIAFWRNRIAGGQQSDVLLSQIDWLASLSELIGARLPKGSAPDSKSHLHNLLGDKNNPREWVLEQSSNKVLSVRTQRWKYIEPNDGGAKITWGPDIETGNSSLPQLYDMSASLFESCNVAKEHPEVVFDLQNVLRRVRFQKP